MLLFVYRGWLVWGILAVVRVVGRFNLANNRLSIIRGANGGSLIVDSCVAYRIVKYDVLCLPGVTPPGCGATYIEDRIGDDHSRGDRVSIVCKGCGRVRVVEVRGRLEGLARMNANR